jgi:hypothetical protein
MLKLTSLGIGLLTVISMVPAAQALPIQNSNSDLHRLEGDLHSQIILNVNPQIRREQEYHYRWEAARRRQLELEREREAQERLAAERRRHRQYAKHHSNGNSHGEYRDYHSEYRRDR